MVAKTKARSSGARGRKTTTVTRTLPRRPKMGFSKTWTIRRKKPRLNEKIPIRGEGSSFSRYLCKKRVPRYLSSLLKVVAPNIREQTAGERLDIVSGQQAQRTYVVFSPDELVTLGNLQPDTPTITGRFVMQYASTKTMFTNQTKSTVYLDLYEIVSRHDVGGTSISNHTPQQYWADGMADMGPAGAASQYVGLTPFKSDKFTQYFKVNKIYHVELGQGRSHIHSARYELNRIIHAERATRTKGSMGQITCWLMVNAWGAPVNSSTDVTIVSTGSVALDIVRTKILTYSWVADYTANYTVDNTLATISLGTQRVMDTGSGEPEAQGTA